MNSERIRRATEDLSEDSTWRSIDGRYTVIKEMNDAYLSNLSNYAKRCRKDRPEMFYFFTKLMNITIGLLVERGKANMLMNDEQIPYRSGGKWVKWDYDSGPVEIDEGDVPYVNFISDGTNL